MAERTQHLPLIAAAALLALGSGCVTPDASKKVEPKKPDVTQPGVLPPPQELMKPASAVASGAPTLPAGTLTQTGASVPGPIAPGVPVTPPRANPAPAGPSAIAKLSARMEKKMPAAELAVAWRNRIAYLPDPTKNGAMGCGLVGQMFLYGLAPKLEFAEADGVLTIDLVDETPRPAGQPAAKAERWQFDKNTLRNLKTNDETFGKSYVLFLPWPDYKPDITKVRISARYDPESGHTLYQPPTVVSIDTSAPFGAAPVWDGMTTVTPIGPGAARTQPFGGGLMAPPAGGMNPPAPAPNGGPMFSAPLPVGAGPVAPGGPLAPSGVGGPMPGATPEGFPPIAITIGKK
jgi:hypothetical protein